MKTLVSVIDSKGDTPIKAVYTLPPEKALVAFFMQNVLNDYNTANYPAAIPDIRRCKSGALMCDAYQAHYKMKGVLIGKTKYDWILYAKQIIA